METLSNTALRRQQPLLSGFGPQSTAEEVLEGRDLSGKTVIITGGYSGLGLETTSVLAEAGASVIVPMRTPKKAAEALAGLPNVTAAPMDLLDPGSIDAFAAGFMAEGRPLDLLILSAGIMATPLVRDLRGYESQFAVNHLGHFQLTARLWPALRQAVSARVIVVSSRGHRISGIDFGDPNFEQREYEKWAAYGQSKTANILFAAELDKRGKEYGVRALSLHPGSILTDLSRHLSEDELRAMGALDEPGRPVPASRTAGRLKTVQQGAATSVWCAVSELLADKGGVYCEDADIASVASPESRQSPGVEPYAVDPDNARQLWTLSEDMTGVKFEF